MDEHIHLNPKKGRHTTEANVEQLQQFEKIYQKFGMKTNFDNNPKYQGIKV